MVAMAHRGEKPRLHLLNTNMKRRYILKLSLLVDMDDAAIEHYQNNKTDLFDAFCLDPSSVFTVTELPTVVKDFTFNTDNNTDSDDLPF
jgi:hypothetical protein